LKYGVWTACLHNTNPTVVSLKNLWIPMKHVGRNVVRSEVDVNSGLKTIAKVDEPPKVNLLGVVIGKTLRTMKIR
jgi:hypothetical protein